jgi:hypothetical protein
MKNNFYLLGLLSFSLAFTSCSKDEETPNLVSSKNLKIVAKTTYSLNKTSALKANSGVVINAFKINIKEIEFEMDEDFSTGDGFYGDDDDVELAGPFELNLLNNTTEITSLNIPNGVYEEVEFKMAKNTNTDSEMFNKSVKIEGTINGTPFIFWHNVNEDFEIDYEDTNQNLVITDASNTSIVFNFDLNTVINSVDFSVAIDGNNDGLIEISPNDTDGNQNLANLIKNKIKESCDLD